MRELYMLCEIVGNFVGIPAVGGFVGAVVGICAGLFVDASEISNSKPECARYMQCQAFEPWACSLSAQGIQAYAQLNSSTLSIFNAMAERAGQKTLSQELEDIKSKCIWTQGNCPNPDPVGVAACKELNEAWNSVPVASIKALWISTTVGAGLGLVLGVINQVSTCRQHGRYAGR